jgi:hypothetical protein
LGFIPQIYKNKPLPPLFPAEKAKKTFCSYVASAAVQEIDDNG